MNETAQAPAPPGNPIIRGERVYLRPAERSDLPTFVRWLNEADTVRYLTLMAPMSLASEERWFDGLLERQGTRDFHFVICLLADGRAIGTAGLHEVDRESGSAAFGIAIGDEADRSQGYGTDALRAICDFGFGSLRLERIYLDVFTPNQRAIRSYERAGFVLEGTQRRAHFSDGRFEDTHRMSLLRDEWLALRGRSDA
jgi:RimJ/RimL family protein N-acetyltransferase